MASCEGFRRNRERVGYDKCHHCGRRHTDCHSIIGIEFLGYSQCAVKADSVAFDAWKGSKYQLVVSLGKCFVLKCERAMTPRKVIAMIGPPMIRHTNSMGNQFGQVGQTPLAIGPEDIHIVALSHQLSPHNPVNPMVTPTIRPIATYLMSSTSS